MRKWQNIWAFYRSVLAFNFALSVAIGLLGGIAGFAASFLVLGFAASIAVKEVRNASEYIFYRNNGISRLQLWASSFGLNVLIFVLLILILTFFGWLF